MTTLTPERLAELERLARRAHDVAPERWIVRGNKVESLNGHLFNLEICGATVHYDDILKHVAAANPTTTLELITALREQAAHIQACHDSHTEMEAKLKVAMEALENYKWHRTPMARDALKKIRGEG